jgi:hypothetical protein
MPDQMIYILLLLWGAAAVWVGLLARQRGRSALGWTVAATIASPPLAAWLLARLPTQAAEDWVGQFEAYVEHEERIAVAALVTQLAGPSLRVIGGQSAAAWASDYVLVSAHGTFAVATWLLPDACKRPATLSMQHGRLHAEAIALDDALPAVQRLATAARELAAGPLADAPPLPILLVPDSRHANGLMLDGIFVMDPRRLRDFIFSRPVVLDDATIARLAGDLA